FMRGLERPFECLDGALIAACIHVAEADHCERIAGAERSAPSELKFADGVVIKAHLAIRDAKIEMRRAVLFVDLARDAFFELLKDLLGVNRVRGRRLRGRLLGEF